MNDREINRGVLLAGLFFIAAGVLFLLDRLDVFDLELRYVLPALLILLGAGILLSGRSRDRDRDRDSDRDAS